MRTTITDEHKLSREYSGPDENLKASSPLIEGDIDLDRHKLTARDGNERQLPSVT